MSEVETKYIVGTCTQREQRPGSDWVKFHIDVGSKYPVKLDTKLPAIIAEADAVGGDVATWKYKESDSANINPNSGQPYKDRHLEAVRPGNQVPEGQEVSQPGSSGGGGGGGREYSEEDKARFDARERRDYRSRAWAHTNTLFRGLVSREELDDPDAQRKLFAAMQALQRKIYIDICEQFAFPDVDNDPNLPSDGGSDEWGYTEDPDAGRPPLSPHDDNIPF